MKRPASTVRVVKAGCFVCHGSDAKWKSPNAAGLAARHHDATGHQTWTEQGIRTVYGLPDTTHPDLFEPQAAAS